jgi:hypothetical protein
MAVTIELSPDEESALIALAAAQKTTVESLLRMSVLALISPSGIETEVNRPTKSFLGALAHLGKAPSADEIEASRREMFGQV